MVQFISLYLVFKAFNQLSPVTTILLGAVIVYLSYMLMAAPGYVGTYEAYWALTFQGLGLTQIDLLLAMGLVSHLVDLIITITLGCIGIIWLDYPSKKSSKYAGQNVRPHDHRGKQTTL